MREVAVFVVRGREISNRLMNNICRLYRTAGLHITSDVVEGVEGERCGCSSSGREGLLKDDAFWEM